MRGKRSSRPAVWIHLVRGLGPSRTQRWRRCGGKGQRPVENRVYVVTSITFSWRNDCIRLPFDVRSRTLQRDMASLNDEAPATTSGVGAASDAILQNLFFAVGLLLRIFVCSMVRLAGSDPVIIRTAVTWDAFARAQFL